MKNLNKLCTNKILKFRKKLCVGNKFCGLCAEKVLTVFFYLYLQAVLDSPDEGNIFLEIKTRFPDLKSKFCKSITSLNSFHRALYRL